MQEIKLTDEVQQVLKDADILYTRTEVEIALDRMAAEITVTLANKNPLILCLMIGAVIPVGILIPKLNFPLELDYVHATRYKRDTKGGHIEWLKKPSKELNGRIVLLLDDILDEGFTLSALIDECKKNNAAEIYTAVLVDKQVNRTRSLIKADFTGLNVPDRYVFGYGMDYKGYLRNVPGIYAVKRS
jgi:hypoxanthine phosphoribosyltransferase